MWRCVDQLAATCGGGRLWRYVLVGVCRRGEACEQLVGAANRTAFKAALKHVSGGKKKGSAGSPAR